MSLELGPRETVSRPCRSAWRRARSASLSRSCRTVSLLLVLAEPEVLGDFPEALATDVQAVATDDAALAVAPQAPDLPTELLPRLHRLTPGTSPGDRGRGTSSSRPG